MKPDVMVYGGSGFTGKLILHCLRERGIPFVVAGRNPAKVHAAAEPYGAKVRTFDLTDTQKMRKALSGIRVLMNAAGPFGVTAAPLLRSCLAACVHYLDVSGEVRALDLASRLDGAARASGIMILPAVGFDVVPSDCLAAHLSRRLPDAEELTLSVEGSNLLSRGSALTFAAHAGVPSLSRKGGALEPMLQRVQMRWTDFGDGPRPTIATSWGDLVTAFRSTGIPNIEVYFEATPARVMTIGGNQWFGWMTPPWARNWFEFLAEMMPEGPPANERRAHSARIVGEARRGARRVRSLVTTGEAYSFTGIAAAAVIEKVLSGHVSTGFQTPGTLLGPDFALSLGAERRDLS